MNSSQKGGKSKSSKSSSSRSSNSKSSSSNSKTKKGGNFLGSVSELFVPTGWENFATAAGLLAIDRADAAFRRGRNSSKKQKGGADLDGHESVEAMDNMLDQIQSETDAASPAQMDGGAKKKKSAAKKTTKKPAAKKTTKKPAAKKATKKPAAKKATKKTK
jgi:hypothetical protein